MGAACFDTADLGYIQYIVTYLGYASGPPLHRGDVAAIPTVT
jgi:hypothetical protein